MYMKLHQLVNMMWNTNALLKCLPASTDLSKDITCMTIFTNSSAGLCITRCDPGRSGNSLLDSVADLASPLEKIPRWGSLAKKLAVKNYKI